MISPRLVFCTLVILLVAASAHGQAVVPNPPTTSGAMLTINGTVNGIPVNIVIYDSQIHSGVVQDDACDLAAYGPGWITDAHVLQGGSLTGCDNGDAYEVTDNNSSPVHQSPGIKDITKSAGQLAGSVTLPGTGFHIETHYLCSGAASSTGCTVGPAPLCNTNGTICTTAAGPDTGFLTVKNNTGQNFTGTITLQGNSPTAGGLFCPPGGAASDSITFYASPMEGQQGPWAAGGTWTFALSTDSSNCGGFNFDQQGTLADGLGNQLVATFQANNDDFIVQCLTCAAGDTATWHPAPVPQSKFNIANGSTVGNGQTCVTFADFSSPNPAQPHGMCPLFQTFCINNLRDGGCPDPETFFWNGTYDYIIDQNTIPNPIGGVHFLGDPGANCAPSLIYSADIGLSYTGAQPGVDPIPPQHSGSGGGLNCFVATYVQGAPAIPVGVTEYAFSPLEPPVKPDLPGQLLVLNEVDHNRRVPLNFDLDDGVGGPGITDAQLCTSQNPPSGCPAGHWVAVGMSAPFACPGNGAAVNAATLTDTTSISTQNFINHGNGSYTVIMLVPSVIGECFNVNMLTSFGQLQFPAATFKVK